MNKPSFESASGLRPAAAFLMIGCVLVLVVARTWALTHEEKHHQPERQNEELAPAPDFDIVDSRGQALALSVQRMDLCLSPNATWQAHTPRRMAERIAPLLEGRLTADELLARMMPDAVGGVIRVDREGWLLDYPSAVRVQEWIEQAELEAGFELRRVEGCARWKIHWRPEVVLTVEMRRRNSTGDTPISPMRWGRRLADGLAQARWGELALDSREARWEKLEEQRERVWKALMPRAEFRAVVDLPPHRVGELIALLDEEGVQQHQMRIDFKHQRVYPARGGITGSGAFQVLGRWRYVDEAEAIRLAGLEQPEAEEHDRALLAGKLLDVKHPRSGLEGLVGELLAGPEWGFIEPQVSCYHYRKDWPVHQPSRRYFFSDQLEGHTPRVFTTLDSDLQEFLHRRLEDALEEHDAAITMGIAIDVASGDVLAVDGISRYEVSEFIPTWHLFTPGSTFKVIVMCTALDCGAVTPDDWFDTHDGNYRIPGSRRVIHEARGAPRGSIQARDALSMSVNAVMVQIGTRVDDEHFHAKLKKLRYGELPGTGVGAERRGSIPKLPWKTAWAHASVSFGHELSISLWQHAAAVATVLRGGTYRPLRVLSGVEWNGEYYPLKTAVGEDVYSASACHQTREMMFLGAREGTGRHLSKIERDLGTPLVMASKTGTTEKKPTEPCLHLELDRNQYNAERELKSSDPGFVTFRQMMAVMRDQGRPHRRSCYTSSICLLGRVPGEEREVMVLLVVEEPRGDGKYGSDVAGPTAVAVLKEALGITRDGIPKSRVSEWQPDYGYAAEANLDDHPWAHDRELDW